jgi:valyl-tRNA synthetase
VPLINRSVPIFYDAYVDMVFGTGRTKGYSSHDINDYMLGGSTGFCLSIFSTTNGTLSPAAKL